jgi:Tfp pilus assembly protein PilN
MIQAVNLIPQHRRQEQRRKQRMRLWVAIALVYMLLLVGLWAVAAGLSGRGSRAVSEELAHVAGQIEDTQTALRQLEPRLAQVQTTLAASRSIGDQPDWSVLLLLLADLLGEQNVLVSCTLTPNDPSGAIPFSQGSVVAAPEPMSNQTADAYLLVLSGMGQNHEAVSDYVLRLEDTKLFAHVELLETHKAPFHRGHAIAFSINCQLNAATSAPGRSLGSARGGRRVGP